MGAEGPNPWKGWPKGQNLGRESRRAKPWEGKAEGPNPLENYYDFFNSKTPYQNFLSFITAKKSGGRSGLETVVIV